MNKKIIKEINYKVTADKLDSIKSKLKQNETVTIIGKKDFSTVNKPNVSSTVNSSTTNNDSVVNEEVTTIKAGELKKEKKVIKEDDLIKKISSLNHYLVKHSFYPELADKTFIQDILSRRLDIIKKRLKKYEDLENLSVNELKNKALYYYGNCISLEKKNKKKLQNLTEKIVLENLDLPEEIINIKCFLVSNSKDLPNKFQKKKESETKIEFENTQEISELKKEKEKRYIVNALIDGFSKSYDYLYKMFEKEILNIEPKLMEYYDRLLVINDYLYYVLDEDKNQNIKSGDYIAEKENNKINIDVYSLTLPTLIYEAIKSIFETISLNMLPENEKIKKYIHNNVDLKDNEFFNSLIGTPLWNEIEKLIPNNKLNLKPYIFLELLSIKDYESFGKSLKEIFANTQEGKKIMNNIIKKIENNFRGQEFENRFLEKKENNKPPKEFLDNANEIKEAF